MKDCQSINCDSCGGSVKLYSNDYGKCQYCGNTNKVLKGGETAIVPTKPKWVVNAPKPTTNPPASLTKWQIVVFILGIGVCLCLVHWFYNKKLRTNIQE